MTSYNLNFSTIGNHITLLAIFLFTFLSLFPNYSDASQGTYGWFSPKVEYIDSNLPPECDPTKEASIEIMLVENETKSLLSDPIGYWEVNVRDKTTLGWVGGDKLNGQKQSSRICFDPMNDGLQVKVFGSTHYHEFMGPTILPGGSGLDTMIGSHFRGYLQLDKKAITTPTMEIMWPNGEMFNGTPEFIVRTNRLNNLFDGNNVRSTRIYTVSQTNTTDSKNRLTFHNDGFGAVIRNVSGPSDLNSGHYYWTAHQELNGTNVSHKYTSPARVWHFSGIPSTGAPDFLAFTVDKTAPNTAIRDTRILSVDGENVTIRFRNEMSDSLSGLASTTIFIFRVSGNELVGERSYTYPAFTSSLNQWVNVGDLRRGESYRIFAITEDNLGNYRTSDEVIFSIPTEINVPTVLNEGHSTTTVFSQYTLRGMVDSLNGSNITDYGICWSISANTSETLRKDEPGVNCSHSLGNWNYRFPFTRTVNLPSNTTVYYRAYAVNSAGFGYSTIGTINTPETPYDPSLQPPTIPAISFLAPLAANLTPVSFNPGIRIDSLGGHAQINFFGICISLSEPVVTSINPMDVDADPDIYPNCRVSNDASGVWRKPLVQPILPYGARHTFNNLDHSSVYYIKIFAANDEGLRSSIHTATTSVPNYYFRHTTLTEIVDGVSINESPRVIYDDTDFNISTNLYDNVTVRVFAVDDTYFFPPDGSRRDINFTAELDLNNNSVVDETKTGTAPALRLNVDGSADRDFYRRYINFENLPLGTHKITVRINEPEDWSPQFNNLNRERQVIFTLRNPYISIDSLTGSDDNTGSNLILDPELSLVPTPAIIKAGDSTFLRWTMKNVNGQMNCTIKGPSTFVAHDINHTFDPTPGVEEKTGTVPSGSLFNAQIFNFSCVNPLNPANVYRTTTRVTIIGRQEET